MEPVALVVPVLVPAGPKPTPEFLVVVFAVWTILSLAD